MNISIKQILIFNADGEKRSLPFNEGLNIISGDSKTGKSAIIEIIDYCLFSSRSSIPKGKIIDFASLFSVIFKVEDIYIIIGRYASYSDKHTQAYISCESDYEKIKDLNFEYYKNLSLKPIKNNVQTEFEEYIGLSLKKLSANDEDFGKLSVRDTVSFLFQHQNLIANKHAIFYRFDDINKRKRVIEALPVLLGLVDPNYYDLIKQKKQLEKLIRAEEKFLDIQKQSRKADESYIRSLITSYYNLLGFPFDSDISFSNLKKIALNLPTPPEIISSNIPNIKEIEKLKNELEALEYNKVEIEESISLLESNNDDSHEYSLKLKNIYDKQLDIESKELKCPLCDNEVLDLNNKIKAVNKSKESLIKELSKLNAFSKDNTDILENLRKENM